MNGIGVNERDFEAEEARPRLAVDQLCPCGGERSNGARNVVDLVGDVMHAGPPPGEEAPHRGVLARRREQLDAAVADEEGSGLDALFRDAGSMLDAGGEEPLIRRNRLVEVVDRDSEVMNAAGSHRARCYFPVGAACGWSTSSTRP